jgi:hypothetical protein
MLCVYDIGYVYRDLSADLRASPIPNIYLTNESPVSDHPDHIIAPRDVELLVHAVTDT